MQLDHTKPSLIQNHVDVQRRDCQIYMLLVYIMHGCMRNTPQVNR